MEFLKRIQFRRGFARLGCAILVPWEVGWIIAIIADRMGWTGPPDDTMLLFAPVAMFVLPLAVFIVFRTLLWILAGFRGEMA